MSEFSVKKPFTVVVAVIMVLVLGFISFSHMTPNLMPNIRLLFTFPIRENTSLSRLSGVLKTKWIESPMSVIMFFMEHTEFILPCSERRRLPYRILSCRCMGIVIEKGRI